MSQPGVECPPFGKTSRRRFLKDAAALGVAAPAFAEAPQGHADSTHHPIFAYVGTYSLPQGPDSSVGRGQGIYLFEMDPSNGNLKQRELFPEGMNPSCLALDPSRRRGSSISAISALQRRCRSSLSSGAACRKSAPGARSKVALGMRCLPCQA